MKTPGTSSACLRVGITGGIGSGKTTVCHIFEALGVPVYYADHWARWLIENDPDLKGGITALIGPEAYAPDGRYQRSLVASRVFADPGQLASLNALVHPAVERHSRAWHETAALEGAPYTLKEAALMIESGSHRMLDALIVVTAPEEIRIQRVMQRDGLPEAAVRQRMASQLPEAEKMRMADFHIENDGRHALVPRVWALHQVLLTRAAQHLAT